eukprot:scaffold34505_cov124-Isochrysis_galbana.AAC.3
MLAGRAILPQSRRIADALAPSSAGPMVPRRWWVGPTASPPPPRRRSAAMLHACSMQMRSRSEPLAEASPNAPRSPSAADRSSHPPAVCVRACRCPDQSAASHRLSLTSTRPKTSRIAACSNASGWLELCCAADSTRESSAKSLRTEHRKRSRRRGSRSSSAGARSTGSGIQGEKRATMARPNCTLSAARAASPPGIPPAMARWHRESS